MNILLHPGYFPNIATYIGLAKASEVSFEVHDNYQKQTYRNRTVIYSANGKIALIVPVKFSHNNRQLYRDVKIANDGKWQSTHWKSLHSAYSTSPFFEYYADDLAPLFQDEQEFIMEFNFKCLDVIAECLQWDLKYTSSNSYEKIPNKSDLRDLINARKEKEIQCEPYSQVFSNKYGYINNLSILDLLFNEGPNTLNYLQSQNPEGLLF